MTNKEVVQAVEAWAKEICPELNTYEHAPPELASALPLCYAELNSKRRANAGEGQANYQQYQQTDIVVWSINLVVLVDPGDDSWAASEVLYDLEDRLGTALSDRRHTLNGRVPSVSPFYTANFEPPEVEYPDGTLARQVTLTIDVGS